jgi:hypothetical protein
MQYPSPFSAPAPPPGTTPLDGDEASLPPAQRQLVEQIHCLLDKLLEVGICA